MGSSMGGWEEAQVRRAQEVGPGAFCAARRNKTPVILEAMIIVKALLMSQKS